MTTRFFDQASPLSGRSLRLAAGSLLAMVSVGATAHAGNLYVDASATQGTQSGLTWADAYLTLDAALLAAQHGDDIMLAEGLYRPGGTGQRTDTFNVTSRVRIYGGYKGLGGGASAATSPDSPDGSIFATLISGDIMGTRNVPGDDVFHVFTITNLGLDSQVRLDGMRITHGFADGLGANESTGGGVLLVGGWLVVSDAYLTDSFAVTSGGGIHATGTSKLEMKKVRVRDNNTNGDGGGISIEGSTDADLFNLEIRQNFAADNGGGLRFTSTSGGSLLLVNSVFLDNRANFTGGAISMDANTPGRDIVNCTIAFNTAKTGQLSGSGIHVFTNSNEVRLLNSIIHFNPEIQNNDNVLVSGSPFLYIDHSNVGNPSPSVALDMTNETLTSNPVFASNGARAVSLKSTSPCLEAGNDGHLPFDLLDIDEDGDAAEVLDRDIKLIFVNQQGTSQTSNRQQLTASPVTGFGVDAFPFGPIVDMGAYEEWYTLVPN